MARLHLVIGVAVGGPPPGAHRPSRPLNRIQRAVIDAPEIPASAETGPCDRPVPGTAGPRARAPPEASEEAEAERIDESDAEDAEQLRLEALSIGRGRHSPEQSDGPGERVRRLAHRRPAKGLATGTRPSIRRALVEAQLRSG